MERPDLGKLTAALVREVIRREAPILERAGLEMWDYVILVALSEGDAATQRDLAAASGRDKTRLIGNLDRLEATGLVARAPDPADRRNKVVSLTPTGRRVLARCRKDIRAMEDDLLAGITPADREAFVRVLILLGDRAD
ncbi:MarR family winged helix-turn-helix transcriptional regulator [Nocardioides nematodiphilus]|uniref:MarR family winged helix-turn-helix transcriptional regulator n=1 Tax=Nocardioides nematodiphilus TaxID=2849669 RepID=UPI001CD94540|nr:MarR family transcriptional regulator [Nocardioides nematodiphilus]MCA1984638.1 MarR family transcriptional regulator [Nocardioides nematodiphilus]